MLVLEEVHMDVKLLQLDQEDLVVAEVVELHQMMEVLLVERSVE